MEPISSLLDVFIKLVEKIINLNKTRQEDKQRVFKELIDPLFIQLQPVVENYLNIFNKAREEIIEKSNRNISKSLLKGKQNNKENIKIETTRILDEIKNMRKEMLLARSTVKAMAEQVRRLYKDEIITEFAERILAFFDASVFDDSVDSFAFIDHETASTRLVDLFEMVIDGQVEEHQLKEFIVEACKVLEMKWVKVANSYSAAKIYCLSAPNLIKRHK